MKDPAIQLIAQWILRAFPFETNADARTLPSPQNWDSFANAAEENAAAPLLYASLKKLGRENDLPEKILERLRLQYARSDTANWVALRQLENLYALFERAKIPVVVLKGGALATTLYPDPALRPMSDLDFLIPREQFATADRLLRDQGFTSPAELRADWAPRLTNYRAYTRGGNNPARIELHWHLFKSPYYWTRVPIEWFWKHTTEATIQNRPMRVLVLDAQCLHLAAHFALHHHAERLIWSYDLARLLARDGAQLNWDALIETAERFGLALAVRAALMQVAMTWGVCAPDSAIARLNLSRPGWRERTAFALMNAPRPHARFVLDVLSQSGVRAKAEFLWYHLFPARAYLREQYRMRDEKWTFFYLRRFADGALKFFRSLLSI